MPKYKVQSNFIEIALRRGCSPVNLTHIFRTSFAKKTSGWLLLNIGNLTKHALKTCELFQSMLTGFITFLRMSVTFLKNRSDICQYNYWWKFRLINWIIKDRINKICGNVIIFLNNSWWDIQILSHASRF